MISFDMYWLGMCIRVVWGNHGSSGLCKSCICEVRGYGASGMPNLNCPAAIMVEGCAAD